MKPTTARIVVSGSSWMGGGIGSVESALYQFFTQAVDEVLIVAYAIGSGATLLFEQLEELLQRDVRVRMIVNRFHTQPLLVQQQFAQLQRRFPGLLLLWSFVPDQEQADLHAKIVVVDRQQALIGSANFSRRGLANNHELGVIVTGAVAMDVIYAVQELLDSPATVQIELSRV